MNTVNQRETSSQDGAEVTSRTRSESLSGTIDIDFAGYRDPPPEPMGLLREWLDAAARYRVREPKALALATADSRGRTSCRTVVVTRLTGEGLVFTSHAGSRKGRDLAVNPWASGALYWRETSQQITVGGPVETLPGSVTDTLWAARPPFTHAMSAASRQSEPLADLADVAALRERALRLGEPVRSLPRPAAFTGYHLRIENIEFWANGTGRLHERLRYDRTGAGWRVSRLQP